jgi:2-methylcitrate dehydratase PrpD
MDALPETTIAEILAGYVVDLKFEDIPRPALDSALSLLVDQLACQLVGSTLPWTEPAYQLVKLTKGVRPEATVVNHGAKFLAPDVAFINATFGQACEMDDSAMGSSGHIGSATVPAALAVGERHHISGRNFLLAVVTGYEVMYRLMRSVTPHNIARGFHSQSIGGPFASAATTGKILGLDKSQMVNAFGIAGSHSCGPVEYDQSGGEVKRIHAGLGARGGVHAALLATFGLTGPRTIIEGKRGFCRIFSDTCDPSKILTDFGQVIGIPNVMYKMYPTVGTLHSAIRAVERLVATHHFKSHEVERIHVRMAKGALMHGAGIGQPKDVVSAQFSLVFSLALTICKGSNLLSSYMDSRLWSDPEIGQVMSRITTEPDPDAVGPTIQMASVSVRLKDGRELEAVEYYPKGSPRNPVTKEERYAKARDLAGTVLSPSRIERLIETVENIEKLKDVADLARLLVRG